MSQTMRAIIIEDKGKASVQQVPVPTLDKDEVLVKVQAVALNPTDWKHLDYIAIPGSTLGCDFAGEVVELKGSNPNNLQKGDRVAGFVHGGLKKGCPGSFAEYTKIPSTLAWKVPSNLSNQEAAAIGGIGPHTAVQALYHRLNMAQPDAPIKDNTPVLIWGGSTSVGLYALQLAKMSGYKVVTTGSEKNRALLEQSGADAVYSYSDDQTPANIARDFPDLALALDTISEKGTTYQIAKSFSRGKGHIVTLLPVKDENVLKLAPNVRVEPTIIYSMLGHEFSTPVPSPPTVKEDKKAFEQWLPEATELIAQGKFKPNPIWPQQGGLEGILPALDLLRQGKNSAQKVTLDL